MIKCFVLFVVIVSSKDSDIIDFRLFAKLNAFCVNVCEEKNNIAEIKIQGKVLTVLKFVQKIRCFLKKRFIYLFIERGGEGGRETSVCGCLSYDPY